MSTNNQNNRLTRETAWWFIPEEYCTIFLDLEKEFNKRVNIPLELAEIKQDIDRTPKWESTKRDSLKSKFERLSKRIYISSEQLLSIVEDLRENRRFHYCDLADKYDKGDNRHKKYEGYADVMRNIRAEEIVSHFCTYFEHLGILKMDNDHGYSFTKISNCIANYKVPFTTARILLDYITNDSASQFKLLEAMHELIQDPLFIIILDEENGDREKALKTVYYERFRDGIEILRKNGLVSTQGKGLNANYDFIYGREINEDRRKAAFEELQRIHDQFHQTTSTSKEKKKARVKKAQYVIFEKLDKIDQHSTDGRTIFHWCNAILQYRYANGLSRLQAFADDVLIYIRYNNIKYGSPQLPMAHFMNGRPDTLYG